MECLSRRVTGLLALSAGLAVGCASTTTAPRSDSSSPTTAVGAATVSLSLEKTEVPAGQPINGTATVDNRTGKPVAMPDGTCDGWLYVGLSNGKLGGTPANPAVGCAPFVLPVGVSSYPVTVLTNFDGCAQNPATADVTLPACLGPAHSVIPPLPAGTYHTITDVSPPLQVVNSVQVQLTGGTS
jgi:hypothetical protein